LASAHDAAHRRLPRHERHEPVDPRLADRGGDVAAGDRDAPVLAERDGVLRRELGERRAVLGVDPALGGEPGERAVHGAGVEVAEAEPRRERPGDGALAGPCGPVYGNDHRLLIESRSSKKPGKLTATASAPSISTPSREASPAIAPTIAIRWSPSERMPPPRGRVGTPRTRKPSGVAVMWTPSARSPVVTVSIRSD